MNQREIALTAMDEEKGDSIGIVALLVDIMNVEGAKAFDWNVAGEHGESVDLGLSSAPVETFLPACNETFDIGERDAILPAGIVELVWEANEVELLAKDVKIGVGNSERERCGRVSHFE